MKRDSENYYQDDIDHLVTVVYVPSANCSKISSGIGLERMERATKEKMSIQQDMFTTMPRPRERENR